MRKILSFLIIFISMFVFIGCDELKDQFSSGSTSEQQTQYMDSLTYFTEGIDSLSLVAIGNHGAIIGVMEDSVYGRTIYVNRESLPQDSAIIMRLDTLERVSFLSFNKQVITINYHENDNKFDAAVLNENGEETIVKDLSSPYSAYNTKTIMYSTRAGNVLDPIDLITGIGGAVSAGANIGSQVVNGIGVGGSNLDGFLGTSLVAGAAVGGVIIAGVGSGATIAGIIAAGILGGLSANNKIISNYQDKKATEEMGTAQPVTLAWQQTGERQITVSVRVNNVNANKKEFYAGAMIADGTYITKNHHLKDYKETYSGDKIYTFVFDNLSPAKTYKARAFIEPSRPIAGNKVLDYYRYGNVLSNIKLRDDVITIVSAEQSSCTYSNGYYTFGVTGEAVSNTGDNSVWGVALSNGGTRFSIVDEVLVFHSQSVSFNMEISIPKIYMSGNKPMEPVMVMPFIINNGEKRYFESWSKEVPLEYKEGLLSCPDSNHPHAIDLGLPSGTKWCCMNVGASTPEGYGGYYAWGEVNEKSVYNEVTYQYVYVYYDGDSKLWECQNIGSNIAGTSYDVAFVRMGGLWRMPSITQLRELIDNCSSNWTRQNGVNGILLTGKNGSSIFLPAAGWRYNSDLGDAGSYGGYWSSSQGERYYRYDAWSLFFTSGNWDWNGFFRGCGRSVRAVCP